MGKRFFIITYFLLHVPILFILSIAINEGYFGVVKTYKAKCLQNDQYVILQGSPTDDPDLINDLYLKDWPETSGRFQFYCAYYNEIRPHILTYRKATSESDRVKANLAFENFRDSKRITDYLFPKNYELETVSKDYSRLYNSVLNTALAVIVYYLILQILRVIYIYVVSGNVVFHPYKLE